MQGQHKGCCPPGSWPALKTDYVPKGQILHLDGVPLYHIGSGNRVVILFNDIFGAFTGRHQSIADTFAQWGYNVYLPEILTELYVGDPTDFGKIVPYAQGLDQATINKRFANLIALLEKQGHKRYFGLSFCWGVWKAFKFATEYQGFIAIAGFHPSIMCQILMGGVESQLTSKVKCPAFLYPAGNDVPNIKQGGELVKILQDKHGAANSGTLEFPDMVHGWVVRGDLADPKVARDTEKAIQHSHEYFQKFQV